MKLLEYILVRMAVAAFRVLPLSWARLLGKALGGFCLAVLRNPRKVAERNLSLCFPDWAPEKIRGTLRGLYRQLGLALGEVFHLPRFNRAWMEANVRFEGQEPVDGMVRDKRGVIALVSHFGNWELHGALWALRGYPLKVVAFPQSNPRVDGLIRRNRESSGMKVVYTGHHGTAEILAHLKEGGVVGILADQNAGKSGLRLPFFRRDCSVAKAPAVLARKTGAALVPSFLLREGEGRFVNVTLPEVPMPHTEDVEKDVEVATRAWLKVQEDFIRGHPDHYFWLHRRWKHYE